MTSLSLLLTLWAVQDSETVDPSKQKLYVYDGEKGMTLRVAKDGAVHLTVTKKNADGEEKVRTTYTASSADAFFKEYPRIAQEYGLGRYLQRPVSQQNFEQWWNRLKREGGLFPPMERFRAPADEDLKKWMEQQRQWAEELQRLFRRPGRQPRPIPRGREFGIKVEAPGETLQDQLSLGKDEGVLVTLVKPGSLAERTGMKKFDLILKLGGKPVKDKWEFRTDVLESLSKPEFELELIRAGKRTKVKVLTHQRR